MKTLVNQISNSLLILDCEVYSQVYAIQSLSMTPQMRMC